MIAPPSSLSSTFPADLYALVYREFWDRYRGYVIRKKLANGDPVRIGDAERKSGVYILGKPRMGKSWLIVNMILQDIKQGHGVFFLDPHGDAIDDLIKRTDSDVILFD